MVTAILWGTTGTAATFAPDVGPLAIGAAALGVGGLLQGLIAIPDLHRHHIALRQQTRLILIGALGVFIYPLVFYSSMHLAGVAVGTVVSLGSAPIASGVMEWLIDSRRPTHRWMAAAVLGIGGSAVLCVAKMSDAPDGMAGTIGGVGLGLVAGVTYALYSWSAYQMMSRGIGRAAAMGSIFGLGGLALVPVLLITGAPLLASAQNFAVGAYMALVPMFIGYVLFGYGLSKVSPSTATTITLAEPALAAVLAVVIVGERLPMFGWLGLFAIALSLVVLTTATKTTSSRSEVVPLGLPHETH